VQAVGVIDEPVAPGIRLLAQRGCHGAQIDGFGLRQVCRRLC
jgi:hypothetical protein